MADQQPTPEQLQLLWTYCRAFVETQQISCPEAVCQNDDVIANAYEFIEGVAEQVGYYTDPNDV